MAGNDFVKVVVLIFSVPLSLSISPSLRDCCQPRGITRARSLARLWYILYVASVIEIVDPNYDESKPLSYARFYATIACFALKPNWAILALL